jgi:hypothetical protein
LGKAKKKSEVYVYMRFEKGEVYLCEV